MLSLAQLGDTFWWKSSDKGQNLREGLDVRGEVDALRRPRSAHLQLVRSRRAADLAEAAQAINRMLATGRLRGRIGATFHLAEAAEAHRALEGGGVRGRILILP